MFKKTAPVLLLGTLLLAMPIAGMSQSAKGAEKGTTTVPVGASATIESLIKRYTPIAGSDANAASLINGLRSGSSVTLVYQGMVDGVCTDMVDEVTCFQTGPGTPPMCFNTGSKIPVERPCKVPGEERETFTPLTGNMGLGNVDIALAFTEAQLVELGLSTPTPKELVAALMSGEVSYGTTNPKLKKNLPGILKLRAAGKGWGQIAADLGYKLQ